MDEVLSIVFGGGLILFVLFGPWVLVWAGHRRRKREREEDRQRLGNLTSRVYALEQTILTTGEASTSTTTAKPGTPVIVSEPRHPIETPARKPSVPSPTPEEGVAEAWVRKAPIASPPAEAFPTNKLPLQEPELAPPPPQSVPVEPVPSLIDRFKSALDIEEALGTNWLNKLGIGILVLGVAFFLAYQLKTFGPAGKVLVGYVVSTVMLGSGIWFERHDQYRILARAGVGGGWALFFFTTYAMYHVPAAHIVSSQLVDLVLMLAVAAVM